MNGEKNALDNVETAEHTHTHYLLTKSCQGSNVEVLLLFVQVGQGILRRSSRWASDQITSYRPIIEQQCAERTTSVQTTSIHVKLNRRGRKR